MPRKAAAASSRNEQENVAVEKERRKERKKSPNKCPSPRSKNLHPNVFHQDGQSSAFKSPSGHAGICVDEPLAVASEGNALEHACSRSSELVPAGNLRTFRLSISEKVEARHDTYVAADETGDTGSGITSEQSVSVLRSNPITAIFAIADWKLLIIKLWSAIIQKPDRSASKRATVYLS